MPSAGSFQDYTTKFIGPATGFTIGWLYWFGWAVTVALELISIGTAMQRWFPGVSIWVWCLVFGLILFIVNAFSVRSFAETEFWFASIKVMTIIAFILLGGAAMFGLLKLKGGEVAPYLSYYTKDGLFPTGITGILMPMVAVNFSFQGTELIGIASGESENPEKSIPRAINQTVWRTILFFGLAVFVLAGIVPWKEAGLTQSPFVVGFDKIGIPYAGDIVNFVLITAFLSVANSGLYATTRMLYALSKNGMASQVLGKLNKRGVPFNALLLSMAVAGLSLLSYKYAVDTVYKFLLNASGITAILAWMSIAASQFFFRRRYLAEGGKLEDLKYRTPLYPFVPILAFLINLVTLISLWFDPVNNRPMLVYGTLTVIAVYIIYFLFYRKKQFVKEANP
jgi:arginine/ornithine permease